MKLNYHHSGLQFFFITITLAGRRKLLSRLIDERHRPELLPLGELVKSALAADRLLILSGFPEGVENLEAGFRARCLAMNDMAAKLCEAAQCRA